MTWYCKFCGDQLPAAGTYCSESCARGGDFDTVEERDEVTSDPDFVEASCPAD